MGLKEETIKGILEEGAFNMGSWGSPEHVSTGKVDCGTACCIAGHIVAAAARLQTELPQHYWIEDLAFDLWEKEYGLEEARRLDFIDAWPCNLREVTPQQAVAHLNGATVQQAMMIGDKE